MNEQNEHDLKKVSLGLIIALLLFSLILDLKILVFLAILLLVGLILELKIVYTIARVWHHLFISVITYLSNLILAIIYVIILTPYSSLYRLANRKEVHNFLYGESATSSYYIVNKDFRPDHFDHPW